MSEMSNTPTDTNTDRPSNTDAPIELAQTMAHSEPDNPGDSPRWTKQTHDLATAVALLRAGATSLRNLELATKSWTTFGNVPLVDQLVEHKAITHQQSKDATRSAQQALHHIAEAADPGGANTEGRYDRERQFISELDPSGRIAKLLGVADTSVLSHHEIEDRKVGSRYTLLRKLGQGGLGIVWLARDQNLQRYVAIKEIARNLDSGDAAHDHFRREAEITGRLEHPGIVPIYQYGEDETTGKSFYVMRFLGKRTMQDAIVEYHERREAGNHDPMLLHRLLSALINVCHAMGHAHSRKVIHRDLKPENIALDEFGQVTLLDWGLAKINDATGMYDVNGRIEPGDLHSIGSTQAGRVLGTPLYMAPEQASGKLEDIDELTDVYALGGILYAILTGVAPHQAIIDGSDTSGNLSQAMSKIVTGSIKPPSEIAATVPPELNAVCMKALAPKRYLRYASATELEEEIQRFIAGSPVSAYSPPLKQRVKRWMADNPTLTQMILLAASLLMIAAIAIGYTARRGRAALQQARFSSVQEFTRELEANLSFETNSMIRNLQFVSELPLMHAIVVSQSQHPDSQAHLPPSSLSSIGIEDIREVSPAEWLARQGNLFDGLLNAHPSYLVACTCLKHEDGSIEELVRSERLEVNRRAHRVPQKQLVTCAPKDVASPESQMLNQMRPDQVIVITNDQLSQDVPAKSRSPLVLSGVQAIFNMEGELFGLNIIELDLRQRLEELFSAVAPEHVTVWVTDATGNAVLKYDKGQFASIQEQNLALEFTELAPLFSEAGAVSEFGDGKTLFAKRVELAGSPKARIGIVAKLRKARL